MTDREKLVELISEVQYLGGLEEKVADHLIANGVIFANRLEEKQATSDWIRVTERLPEPMEWVLCACRGSIIEVMRYHTKRGGWDPMSEDRLYIKSFVTHWMPLPELPKED